MGTEAANADEPAPGTSPLDDGLRQLGEAFAEGGDA
jgi:hypothetical protein